jgi:putative aldouronate transport system substrate-binding protein
MLKRSIKRISTIALSVIMTSSLLVGCKANANGDAAKETPKVEEAAKLDEVKLKMYLLGDKPKDFDLVYGKVNEIMKTKINATLDVSFIPWSDMTTKYQLLFQSGEDFDLIFTAAGWGYYSQVATKNGFYE